MRMIKTFIKKLWVTYQKSFEELYGPIIGAGICPFN